MHRVMLVGGFKQSCALLRTFCAAITISARFLALLNFFEAGVAALAGEQQHVTPRSTARLTRHFALGAMLQCVGADQVARHPDDTIRSRCRCGSRLTMRHCGRVLFR